MNIIKSLQDYFFSKETDTTKETAPEGICPNCWGKQEWEGHFYKKIKANNITRESNMYTNFIHEVAQKLDKITLKKDTYLCETCKIEYKK